MKNDFILMIILGGVFTAVIMPLWINILLKFKVFQPIREDGPASHMVKSGTPGSGGLVFYLVWIWVSYFSSIAPSGMMRCLYFVASGFFLLGLYDDYMKIIQKNSYALKAKNKFLLQSFLAVMSWFYLCSLGWCNTILQQHLPLIGMINIPVWLGFLLWIYVIVGSSNAFNLVDGLDGLASGISISILCGLIFCNNLIFATDVNISLAVLIGGLCGFLWFNSKPAAIMMGDCGSLFLGSVMAYVAFCTHNLFYFAIMSFIPIIVTLSVIIQVYYFRLTGGKRWFKMAPLHHHFELSGWGESQIVIRFCLVSVLAVLVACLCKKMFI